MLLCGDIGEEAFKKVVLAKQNEGGDR